ncbi:MAG: metallophosphoesterase family protein [Acidobacteriota bacterium]|nr:metallophosphoesterase family protein [Acidobacteriota bacterium]
MCYLNIKTALDRARKENKKNIELNQKTMLAIFSDLHRGVGDWADDFMHNSLVFANALDYYYKNEFTYVELGDGDELYENRKLINIVRAHGNIFRLLNSFHNENRLCFIWGNHNLQMRSEEWLKKALEEARTHIRDLFSDIKVYESAMLGDKIFMFHGHQGDSINERFALFGRCWVRYCWRPLQTGLGVKDPTSPAQNIGKRNKVEKAIIEWACNNKMIAVAGHTHRPMFCSLSKQQQEAGAVEKPYYFNCGSGVHPRCITCLELKDMTVELVKWHIIADPKDEGILRVIRQPINGCKKDLEEIFSIL